MSVVQLVVCIFALSMAYLSYLGFRRRHFGVPGLVLWEVVWLGLLAVTLFPQVFRPLAEPLHVARLMDLVVIAGMLVLGTITYRTYAAVQQLRRQLERIVREDALAALEPNARQAPPPARL